MDELRPLKTTACLCLLLSHLTKCVLAAPFPSPLLLPGLGTLLGALSPYCQPPGGHTRCPEAAAAGGTSGWAAVPVVGAVFNPLSELVWGDSVNRAARLVIKSTLLGPCCELFWVSSRVTACEVFGGGFESFAGLASAARKMNCSQGWGYCGFLGSAPAAGALGAAAKPVSVTVPASRAGTLASCGFLVPSALKPPNPACNKQPRCKKGFCSPKCSSAAIW